MEGEIQKKPYEADKHLLVGNEVLRQYNFVHQHIRMNNEGDILSDHSPDALVKILLYLTGFYEYLSSWLADEKLRVADLKTSLDFKFSDQYLLYKQRQSETNETARMQAKMACVEDQAALDKAKHSYDKVEAWKKTVGRYHDAVRSQLSYEKSIAEKSRGL